MREQMQCSKISKYNGDFLRDMEVGSERLYACQWETKKKILYKWMHRGSRIGADLQKRQPFQVILIVLHGSGLCCRKWNTSKRLYTIKGGDDSTVVPHPASTCRLHPARTRRGFVLKNQQSRKIASVNCNHTISKYRMTCNPQVSSCVRSTNSEVHVHI